MKLQKKNNEAGFILLGSILLVIVLGILLGAGVLRTDIQLKEARQRIDSENAFYAAETGIEQAVFELRKNIGWQPALVNVPVQYDLNTPSPKTLGFYILQVFPAPNVNSFNSVYVRSEGKDQLQVVSRVIFARVIVINPASFITSTLGNLRLGSGANLNFDVFGRDVYFDVNKSITSNTARQINVQGNVFYLNSINNNSSDPNDVKYTQAIKSPAITFAGVDLNRYRDIAQSNGYTTSQTFTDPINLTSVNNTDGLVFVEGDIHISGDYSDSMLFVATGNIYIDGDLESQTSVGMQTPQIGLLASKDLIIPVQKSDNLNIEAFLMADGADGSKGGIFFAEGDKNKKGTLNFTGSISLRGQGAAPTGVDLNAYSTRNYIYNAQLAQNRLIPFLPFIANVVCREELNSNLALPPPPNC